MSCARYPSWRHGATGRAAWFSLALLTAGLGATTDAAAAPAHRLLRLQQALEAAQRHQPRLRQARANTDAAAAREDPLARALFALGQVYNVFMVQDFVTVNKYPDAAWDELEPAVRQAIAAYLDS